LVPVWEDVIAWRGKRWEGAVLGAAMAMAAVESVKISALREIIMLAWW
jgi:hypothetical protein